MSQLYKVRIKIRFAAFAAGVVLGTTIFAASAAVIPADTDYVQSLNSTWRFKLVHSEGQKVKLDKSVDLASLPEPPAEPFQEAIYDEGAGWTNLDVPGTWEMAGLSPATYYVPDTTAGMYRYWFTVPKSWEGRKVLINFDGVQCSSQFWLNGQPVAVDESSGGRTNYHESGWTAFQVDLTPQVRFGEKNLLSVYVVKDAPSADLDSGDYFFLGGIYRPVTLFSVPDTHFADVTVQTRLLPDKTAEVKVMADVAGEEGGAVKLRLGDIPGETVAKVDHGHALITQIVRRPKLWSAELPNLYKMKLNLADKDGHALENYAKNIGIREVTIKDGVLLVNGVPVKLAGMCRHDLSPEKGTAVGPDLWRKDITLMKSANVNAIRTSHYPYGQGFYDLCDELGMYVADELPYCWCDTKNPKLVPAFLQRARETIRRDKNSPCVILWTIGNENAAGPDLQIVADAVKELDPTRPRNVSCMDADKYHVEFSDDHYPTPEKIMKTAMKPGPDAHPFILLENPNTWDIRLGADAGAYERWGAVQQRTWDACEKEPTVPGTFIFEWQDRAVADPNPAKVYNEFKKTGVQQLDSYPNTGIRLLKMKGLVDGFRNPRPSLYELKMVYSPIQFLGKATVSSDKVRLKLENRYSFTDLSDLTLAWKLQAHGNTISFGETHSSLAPLKTGEVVVSIPPDALARAENLMVDFIHPDGNTVVSHRYSLRPESPTSELKPALPDGLLIPEFNLITRVTRHDKTKWRAVIRHPAKLADITIDPPGATTLEQMRHLTASVIGGVSNQVVGRVTASFSDGEFFYKLDWAGGKSDVQELGWIFKMPRANDHFSWKREGRWTIYPDNHIERLEGTALPDSMDASYSRMDRADDFDFNSTKYDCDWASLTGEGGEGFRVVFDPAHRFQCRGGLVKGNAGTELFVNQQVSPPDDISANVIRDMYLTLDHGSVIEGRFRVGSNHRLSKNQ